MAVPRTLPSGIRWVVERLFAWLSRYRRLNIVYDRAPDLFAAHIWIAVASIISRRLVAEKASTVHSSGASVRPARSVVDLRTPVTSRTRGTSCGPGL